MATATKKILKNTMTSYLCDLISCDTTNPPGNEIICKEVIYKMMNELGMDITIKEKMKGRANYIGRIGNGHPIVTLVGHLDVVAGGEGWTETEPFRPKVKGSIIYGRGAEDNKGGFVASWAGVKLFLENHKKFSGSILLLAAADEEVGNEFGAEYLLPDGFTADYGLIPDAGPMNEVIIGEKGILWIRIISHGKSAHASTPQKGINAANNLAELVLLLQKTDWGKSSSKEFKPTTYNLGVFKSGDAPNIVPGKAIAELDFRRPIGVTSKDILGKVDIAIKKVKKILPEAKFTVEIIQESEPHFIERENIVVQAFLQAAKDNKIWVGTKTIGGNTIGKIFNLHGITSIVHYPSMDETAHMANEHVNIDELYQGALLYSSFLEKLLIK
jgi:succinyl-diaminopimelate desuccinylase